MDNNIKESVGEILGTMLITTDEYKELVKRSAMLDLIFAQAKTVRFSSDFHAAVKLAMKVMGENPEPEETPDAE